MRFNLSAKSCSTLEPVANMLVIQYGEESALASHAPPRFSNIWIPLTLKRHTEFLERIGVRCVVLIFGGDAGDWRSSFCAEVISAAVMAAVFISNLGNGGHGWDPNEGHKIGVVVTCTINHTLEPFQMVQISRERRASALLGHGFFAFLALKRLKGFEGFESFEAFSAGAASPDCLSCQRLGPLKICANQHFSYPKTHGSRIWISFFEM